MKQSGTINNEIIRFFNSLAIDDTNESPKMMQHMPGKHVIDNIMNYARSMNALHRNNGRTFIILNN